VKKKKKKKDRRVELLSRLGKTQNEYKDVKECGGGDGGMGSINY